tara:strand:- start:33 stop:866 length:834 start_codon:yes stop_codon:yes gene_type:complete
LGVEEYNHLIESLSEISILEGEIAKEIDQINFLESKISTQKSIKDSENNKLSAMIEHNNSKGKAKERNDDNQQRLDVLTTECNVLQDEYNLLPPVWDWRLEKVRDMKIGEVMSLFLLTMIAGAALTIITDGDGLSNDLSRIRYLLSLTITAFFLFLFFHIILKMAKNKNEIVQQEWELSDDSKLFEQRMNIQKLLEVKNLERKQLENDLAIYTSEWSKKAISERDATISEQRRTIQQIDDEIKLISSNIADMQTKITTDMERIGEIMKSIEHLIPPP